MKRLTVFLVLLCTTVSLYAQQPFPFDRVDANDMLATHHGSDSTVEAVILREFGEADVMDMSGEVTLVFRYHVRMKILKPSALNRANITLSLFKKDDKLQRLQSARAITYNIENGLITESHLSPKKIIRETYDKEWDLVKFALPNVRVGSIIEYEYTTHTPSPWFWHNYRPWVFQSDIPKLSSEYWATIPANWRYNMALRGTLQLNKNESKIFKERFSSGGLGKADCVRYLWAMENIPPFYEEEYMTCKDNFISAINFELLQMEYFDGTKDKIAKEWRDVEAELRSWDKFGGQLKRGKDVVDESIELLISTDEDPKAKAEKVFDFMRHWYTWNENMGYYSEKGIKKAFEAHTGNVGDINISLIAALRHAGLNVEPVILSTRENGLPTDLYPVLTEFNYVIAKVNIGQDVFLLDATDDFLPFGFLPERCLNGRGRALGEKQSYWYDLKPASRAKGLSMVNLILKDDGSLSRQVRNTYSGYKAATIRRSIAAKGSVEEYIKSLKENNVEFEITNLAFQNLEDISKPLVETIDVQLEPLDLANSRSVLLTSFSSLKWMRNPFKSQQRLYPVDFGVPLDETVVFNLELPKGYSCSQLPGRVGLSLPNNGGKYVMEVKADGQKISMSSNLAISRTIYTTEEYHYLKEMFNSVVKSQNTQLVLEKLN